MQSTHAASQIITVFRQAMLVVHSVSYNSKKHPIMYEHLKNIVPKSFIKKNEKLLRNIVSLFYMGNSCHCNICNFNMSAFIDLNNNDKLCPKCGSLERTRRLWSILENQIQGKKILHFSPSQSIRAKIESLDSIEYVTSDYAGEFKATKRLNIVAIDEPDDSYDIVICYHILEHIENDLKAMKELKRILKPGGKCFIQTPFKSGDIYENEEVKTEEERLIHFGQKDHVRIYSLKGLIHRLEKVGFQTEHKEYTELNTVNGYSKNEKVIIAQKNTI